MRGMGYEARAISGQVGVGDWRGISADWMYKLAAALAALVLLLPVL